VEVLSSRVLLRPVDFERSFRFYAETLGLHVYREWGGGSARGVVFFLGGGYLELSGRADTARPANLRLWMQVRDVDAAVAELAAGGVDVFDGPVDKPWGLREAWLHDPDGHEIAVIQVPDDHPLRRRA
jgi:predicted enzyme related to lactoylglutathione lyase